MGAVPEVVVITPLDFSVRHGGREPLARAQVYGEMPPLAANVTE